MQAWVTQLLMRIRPKVRGDEESAPKLQYWQVLMMGDEKTDQEKPRQAVSTLCASEG